MTYFDPFVDYFVPNPSVYVISDSMLADFKRKNAEQEIAELNKLIDSHKQSIERLQKTVDRLQAELPKLTEELTGR
jgi:uncharacterized coiled-coil protein SlyX